jgi:predicted DNA-binding transcriptional regulator
MTTTCRTVSTAIVAGGWATLAERCLEQHRRRTRRNAQAARKRSEHEIRTIEVLAKHGWGLRAEEIAAATGLQERRVWQALGRLMEGGYVRNAGERGWLKGEAWR